MVEIITSVVLGVIALSVGTALLVSLIKEFSKKCPFCGHDLVYDDAHKYFTCTNCNRIVLEDTI